MRKHHEYSIVVVSLALLTWGCGSKGNDHGSTASSAIPVSSQGNQQAVRLSGCIELSGGGMTHYVLKRVHLENRNGQDPHRTTYNAAGGIVEGSWVRLTGPRDLRALAGHRVEVSGVLVDSGERAVGTATAKKEAGPMIARESIAAGLVPEVRVTEIKDLGETCQGG